MRDRERTRRPSRGVAWAALIVVGIGCTATVPQNRRASQEDAVRSGRGARADIEVVGGAHVKGELIAASSKEILILTDRPALVAVPARVVKRATLGVFQTHEGAYSGWGVAGAFTTLSHGVFLVFSLPIWVITTAISANYDSNRGIVEYPPAGAAEFRMFARFPQGLPPEVDEEQLIDSTPPALAPAPKPAAPAPAPQPAPFVTPDVDAP